MIDLHTHSTASDGSITPKDLVLKAEGEGLTGLAITDHDTVGGIAEAERAARGASLAFIPGVEMSAEVRRGALHIVGLHVDIHDDVLTEALAEAVAFRRQRDVKIARRLTELGRPITVDEVTAYAKGGVVGRPHFAAILVQKHHVRDMAWAFKKYLGKGCAAYYPRQRLDRRHIIDAIRHAGGVPVLAHPNQTRRQGDDLDQLVKRLADMGLEGIETRCSGYSDTLTNQYARLAARYGLVESGGSDYHGPIKPGIALGRGPGSLHVPDAFIPPLAERARCIRETAGACGNRTHPARC